MKKIFISYAKEDESEAQMLFWELARCGFDVWIDFVKLKPGEDWQLKIEQAIRNCNIFIACLSKRSVSKRGYVQSELKQALRVLDEIPEGKVFLVPVRLDNCDIPHKLQHIHYINLFEDGAMARLINSITGHLQKKKNKNIFTKLSVLNFVNIKIDDKDINWAELPVSDDSKILNLKYKQFFKLVNFVHSADLIFDVSVVNQLVTPIVLTHLGIEVVRVSHDMYAYGIPEATKIIKTDSYELEIPNIYQRLLGSIEEKEGELKPTKLNEFIYLTLHDPIYFEPQAPYRFSLCLKHYEENIPNQALIRLVAKTDSGLSSSHLIRTFTL